MAPSAFNISRQQVAHTDPIKVANTNAVYSECEHKAKTIKGRTNLSSFLGYHISLHLRGDAYSLKNERVRLILFDLVLDTFSISVNTTTSGSLEGMSDEVSSACFRNRRKNTFASRRFFVGSLRMMATPTRSPQYGSGIRQHFFHLLQIHLISASLDKAFHAPFKK